MKEWLWLKGFLGVLVGREESVIVYCDRQSALHLVKNYIFYERLKYIDIKLYFMRDVVLSGRIKVAKIGTKDNPTDAITKILSVGKFDHNTKLIQVVKLDL